MKNLLPILLACCLAGCTTSSAPTQAVIPATVIAPVIAPVTVPVVAPVAVTTLAVAAPWRVLKQAQSIEDEKIHRSMLRQPAPTVGMRPDGVTPATRGP